MVEERKIICPWCGKGEVYIEGSGKVSVSVRCPKGSHCFKVNLENFKVMRIPPKRKTIAKSA